MQAALRQWVAAMPAGATTVSSDGSLVFVQACDPGPDATITLNNRSLDAMQVPAARSSFMLDGIRDGGLDPDKAFSFGDCVVHAVSFDEFVARDHAAFQRAYDDCITKVGG
jgi:hypothetical protein